MAIENYLMIENNVVTNICPWDGNVNTWQPPADAIMLVQATTPTKIWNFINGQYQLIDSIGNADIGFTWDGEFCITNQPKPIVPEINGSISTGTQTL